MAVRHIVAIGGSDAGISAALRARELDPTTKFTVVVADAYPNFSICGIPYYVSGEVTHWTNLAHRTAADLAATGMTVLTDTRATRINSDAHTLDVVDASGTASRLDYDTLIVGTGAVSARPPLTGLTGSAALSPQDGVHLLHSMGDTFEVMNSLTERDPKAAVIIGAGYIGLEMAEGLTLRGIKVTEIEALPEVLPTVDRELGSLIHNELERNGVEVLTNTAVTAITRADCGELTVAATEKNEQITRTVDLVLVVVGVRPDTELAAAAGAELGVKGSIMVDEAMRTNLPDVFAAGDCVHTHHRLGDHTSGQLLGAQLVGHRSAEVAKRVDTYATALFHSMSVDAVSELDLSYTPPLGSPWDAVQIATQAWVREHQLAAHQSALTV
jgi:NADPH-dependent 2,4-dienoyl-CoA reductase/sulfur reductase-like enzyme